MKGKILFLILPLLLIAGCNSDDEDLPPGPGDQSGGEIKFEMGFAADDGLWTRASTGVDFKTEWEAGDEIGLFAVRSGDRLGASGNILHNIKVIYTGTDWNGGYWPNSVHRSEALDFYAYYPYNEMMTDPTTYTFSTLTDQRTNVDYNMSDLLIAKAAHVPRTSGTVSLQFSHALSLVQVEVKREVNVPHFDEDDLIVTLTGTLPDALLNWTTSLKATGTLSHIVMHKVVGMDYTYRALVPAQTLASDSKFTFVQTTQNKEIDMEYEGIQEMTLTTGKVHKYRVTLGWGTDPDHAYVVGARYPHTGPPIGIVYEVESGSNGKHGKVVSLTENRGIGWSVGFNTTGATDMNDGRVNMATLYNITTDFSGYPAFSWVHSMNGSSEDYNNTSSAIHVWYLPALNELKALYNAYAAYGETDFNTQLMDAGGTAIGSYSYWSSSEYDLNDAYGVSFNDGSIDFISKSDNEGRVRPVLAF